MKKKSTKAMFVENTIPTYLTDSPMDLPFFFEKKPYQGASGKLYPLQFNDTLTGSKVDKKYQVGVLENDYIRIEVLPEIGGKINRGYDKLGKYDFMYYNSVIKPALIGLAGPWVSGGIEFNWPQHHRPTTFLPLASKLEHNSDGSATIWMGEVDPMLRMKAMVGITVEPSRSYCKAKVKIFNRTETRQPFMWWANLAVPVNDAYQIVFPPDVEYTNDHDRRAVIGWPIARGVYQTARPFDFGEGTDLSLYKSVKVPSSFMVSEGQSAMDFVCGYDHGKEKGIVAWADHRIAPGKKLFHWGDGDFGEMWCSNLTDEDGPYVELMTGVYTDNQPDFCWILPGETREFEQYWYPVRDIGAVKNATIDAALNMEKRNDALFIGIHATGCFPKSFIRVKNGDSVVWSLISDLSSEQPFTQSVPWQEGWEYQEMSIAVFDERQNLLVDFKVPKRGEKAPLEPRKPVVPPSEIGTIEDLYINGLHLEQYKQHHFDPKDYFLEALRRDPDDIRCNTAMGRLSYKFGLYEECLFYCNVATKRLLSRNEHPSSVEALYLKALACIRLGEDEEAYPLLGKVLWSLEYRSAAFYEMACIDSRRGLVMNSLENLEACLKENFRHTRASNLKSALLRRDNKALEQLVVSDPLDLWTRFEQYLVTKSSEVLKEINRIFGSNPQWYFDVICEYMYAGLYQDALSVLAFVDGSYPIVKFYHAYLLQKLSKGLDELPEYESRGVCFPNRPEDLLVLQFALDNDYHAAEAAYLAGCLLYDKERYDEAIDKWERAIALEENYSYALRNLAIAYFDKKSDKRGARLCMEKAFALTNNARIFYEYQQLLRQSNFSSTHRLALYERNKELTKQRDDLYLDWIVLLCAEKSYEEAIKLIGNRTFHIYEGGEGKLTKQHSWLYVLYGLSLIQKEEYERAMEMFRQALVIPKQYGEAKSWFAQDAHIYFYMGELLQMMHGDQEEVEEAYKTASIAKSAVSEISLFRALALQRLHRYSEARIVLVEMLDRGESLLRNLDLYSYFGVGSVTPTPFDYDIKKTNSIEGSILKAFALLGLGRLEEAQAALTTVRFHNAYDFRLSVYEIIAATV